MANRDDYLTDYRQFFEHFAKTVNPNEQLPVKLASYKLINVEVVGGIIDWTTQYLTEKKCPKSLLSPLIKIIIEEVRTNCKKDPIACGFNTSENAYEPLKLMQSVILQVNEICLRYLDNSMLCSLPSPGPPYNLVSYHAVRNSRRRMEDRHVIVHDLNTIFNKSEVSPSSYYAIFDGHGGQDAAAYSAAHLHQYLAESKSFAGQPDDALTEAFCRTDLLFIEKCKVENFSGGSTALCALLRPKEKSLFVAWVGDSQAILARQGLVEQCVRPHKPDREDERKRIEAEGGSVIYWGTWRVNGQLAVSRAIGDSEYKPFINAIPDVREYALDGTEDFLVLACDGLWDVLRDDDAALIVYNAIYENPDIVADTIARRLVQESKEKGSTDNISVIVVFLKEPAKIAAEPRWEIRLVDERMEAGFDSTNASSNPFASTNGADILATHQKDAFLLDLDGFRPHNAAHAPSNEGFFAPSNGKNDFDEDLDDLGPETDVDAVDEVQSPVKLIAGMSEELEEKVTKEIDANLLKSIVENCTDSNLEHDEDDEHDELAGVERKEETPTPPADDVHDAGLDSDSEDDEWNYIKTAREDDKENLPPASEEHSEPPVETQTESAPTVDESEEIDNMSQLNPNAEEFVPVSPTRMEQRGTDWTALKDEPILAQSPRRVAANCDFNVPEENDFVEEANNRPSGAYSNGHENGHKQSSQEMLENLLNGKNIDEIEFQPTGSPSKVTVGAAEQFIFGPNSAAFSTPNKFMDQSRSSTKANYGDDSAIDESEADLLDRLNKEKDPMSMSFYQDKDDGETPFDVDKEEKYTDEKEQEEPLAKTFDDSISSLPEHNPLENAEPITTDLDHKEDEDFGVCKLPTSPLPAAPAPVENLCDLSPEEPAHVEPVVENTSSPLLELDESTQPDVLDDVERRFDTDDEIIERPQEPLMEVGPKSPVADVIAEEPEVEDFAPSVDDHFGADLMEPVAHPEPVVCYASREAELHHQEAAEEISESSDNQQQEFIPETSLEIAQSPEPVVLDFTPDQESLPPMSPQGIHTYAVDRMPEPEPICRLPAPEELEIRPHPEPVLTQEVLTPEFIPIVEPVVETQLISPVSEQDPVNDSFEKHVEELMESETPKIVEPVLKMTEDILTPVEDIVPSEVADVMSPVDDVTSSIKDDSPVEEAKEIKHELITNLESPIEIVESPIRETEVITIESSPEVVQEKEEVCELPKETASAPEVAAIVAAAAVTTVTVGAGVIAEAADTKKPAAKTKTGTSAPIKKSTTATKTTTKPLASTKSTTARPAPAKTAPASKPVPPRTTTTRSVTSTTTAAKSPAAKPRVPLAAASRPAADKKPLTNGDAKAAAPAPKVPPIKRPQVPSTARTTTAPKPAGVTTAAKPAAATTKSATSTLKPATKPSTTTTAAPRPKPTSLSSARITTTSKTTTSRPLSSSATSTTTRTITQKTTTTTTAPRPKPASAPVSKPRVPLSARTTTTTTRAPDAEKQNKENVNKLTASRTAAATRTAATRKSDATKSTSATKSSTLNKAPITKKPLAKNTNSSVVNKSKEEKEKIVPNGVSEEKEKEVSSINEADHLLKDLSPVNNLILDNSQLAEATAD